VYLLLKRRFYPHLKLFFNIIGAFNVSQFTTGVYQEKLSKTYD